MHSLRRVSPPKTQLKTPLKILPKTPSRKQRLPSLQIRRRLNLTLHLFSLLRPRLLLMRIGSGNTLR